MSIQTELTRLTNAKAAIQTAIEGKGVTVPSGTLLDGMAALIESIEAGGSGGGGGMDTIFEHEWDFGSFTPASDITSDYSIEFSKSMPYMTGALYDFFLWADSASIKVANDSWIWAIIINNGTTKIAYGQSLSNSGSVKNQTSLSAIGNINNDTYAKIVCNSSKKLPSGQKYNWLAISNKVV